MPFSTFYRYLLAAAGLTISLSAQAQTAPSWVSASIIGGSNYVGAMVVDAAGNSYEAGSFVGTMVVAGTTLTSAGQTDAFLAKYSPGGSLLWVRQLGSAGTDSALDVVLDAAGNAYVSGHVSGPVTLGNNLTLSSSGAFLIRYSPAGTPEWVQSGRSAYGSGVGTDAAGNVYLTGRYINQTSFAGVSIRTPSGSAGEGTFLARFSASTGALQSLGSAFHYNFVDTPGIHLIWFPKLAVAPTGEAYVLAFFEELPVFGATTLVSRGSTDILVAKYDPLGGFQWVKQVGGPNEDRFSQARVDPAGNLYVAGHFFSTSSFGTTTLTSAGQGDTFLAKYSPQGTEQWVQPGGGTGNDRWTSLSLDAAGNPYATGLFAGQAQFGSYSLSSTISSFNAAVVAYSPQGAVRWLQQVGGTGAGYTLGSYLGLDAQNNLYVEGRFTGTATFGALSLSTTAPSGETFLARLGTAPLAIQAPRPLPLPLSPNPASNLVHLPGLPVGSRVQLLDALGRTARTTTVSAAAQVSVQGLRPGLYTLSATDDQGQQFAGKVVVE